MGNLLFSPSGRINSGDFMKGAIILVAAAAILSLASSLSPALGFLGLLNLVIYWCWIAIWNKRYHDAGKSGWMCLIPIAIYLVLSIIIIFTLLSGDIANIMELATSGASQEEQQAASQAMMKGKIVPINIAAVVVSLGIAFLFNGMLKGDQHDNQFGPQT